MCEHRRPGCHGKCEAYEKWRAGYQEQKAKIRNEKEAAMKRYPSAAVNKKKNKLTGEV
jgi:hypothetical protein